MDDFILKVLHLPPAASEHAAELDRLMFYIHLLMFLLFIGWSIFFLYTLWRFRQRRQAKADPVGVRSHASSYLEGAVALVEAFLLVGFAIPLWARGASLSNYPPEKESTVLRVIGRQFNWITRYPGPDGVFGKGDAKLVTAANPLGVNTEDPHAADDLTIENSEVVVPVDQPVIIHLSSLDVIHCLAIKPMRVTQDAIPGLSIPVWFKPKTTNTYQINCAQLCGNGHSQMRGLLRVLSRADYDAWFKERTKVKSGPVNYE